VATEPRAYRAARAPLHGANGGVADSLDEAKAALRAAEEAVRVEPGPATGTGRSLHARAWRPPPASRPVKLRSLTDRRRR
jgi:hypothetical protein